VKKGVQKIYRDVAATYEKINHVLTLGLDILWRKNAAAAVKKGPGLWLDICSGTGEMAHYLARSNAGATIVSADFSPEMLAVSRRRNLNARVLFTLTDAGRLSFADHSFDLVTISFATRNIDSNRARLLAHFSEFNRVLRPGGLFLNLETSQPRCPLIKSLFHAYIRLTVRSIGTWISGSKAGYRYLSHTIPRFYSAPRLSEILLEAGFERVEVKNYLFGVAALHKAIKQD
jgi:demethylmenaquinone methyltransferase/2-methoxy-6-polyprenyl-1,4-benzoquinol methylase